MEIGRMNIASQLIHSYIVHYEYPCFLRIFNCQDAPLEVWANTLLIRHCYRVS